MAAAKGERRMATNPNASGAQYSRRVPLARDSTSGAPRSQWERELAQAAINRQPYALPTKVSVDPSCTDIPAAHDPAVQQAALEALARSVHDQATGTAEHGFYASKNILGGGYAVGPAFSSGFQRSISEEKLERMKPGFVGSLRNGTHSPSLFVHAHPNNKTPSPVSAQDQAAAENLGIPIAAIDKAGNLTCTWRPQ